MFFLKNNIHYPKNSFSFHYGRGVRVHTYCTIGSGFKTQPSILRLLRFRIRQRKDTANFKNRR